MVYLSGCDNPGMCTPLSSVNPGMVVYLGWWEEGVPRVVGKREGRVYLGWWEEEGGVLPYHASQDPKVL